MAVRQAAFCNPLAGPGPKPAADPERLIAMSTSKVSPEAGFMKRLMRPATCGTRRYAPNNPDPRRRQGRPPRSSASRDEAQPAPHHQDIIVWPKSGSITKSDTSVSSNTIAIDVAGISGRFVNFEQLAQSPRRRVCRNRKPGC